jgi:hypothetical protein
MMRGGIVADVGAKDLEATRMALARAVASGALGSGCAVRRDGDGFVVDGGVRGRVDVTGDGRVAYEVAPGGSAPVRVAEAVVVAAFVSVAGALGWSLMFYAALPVGAVVGAVYAVARIAGDRARLRRQLRALVASLPVLVDARG